MSSPADQGDERRWTIGRLVVLLIVVSMVAMWGYVLYLAFGPGRQAPPDRLDDPAFAVAAQSRCSAALDDIALLPRAVATATAAERSAVVSRANDTFAAMLDDLAALAPDGEDGRLVRAWLADWRTYLQDREAYVVALRSDPEAQLLVSAKDREQITEFLDAFAADNQMIACATPIDV